MHSIHLDNSPASFIPGDEVTGYVIVDRSPESLPASMDIRLQWTTRGKGEKDVGVVDKQQFVPGAIVDGARQKFKLRIPEDGPYSFSGKYISVFWTIELRDSKSKPDKEPYTSVFLIVSPTGSEVILPNLDPPNPFEKNLEIPRK